MGPSYAGMFDQHAQRLTGSGDYVSGGLQGYAGTQREANNIAFSSSLHYRSASKKDIREQENENITRMWDRLSKPSPILTEVLIWVSLGIWVSYTFLGAVSR